MLARSSFSVLVMMVSLFVTVPAFAQQTPTTLQKKTLLAPNAKTTLAEDVQKIAPLAEPNPGRQDLSTEAAKAAKTNVKKLYDQTRSYYEEEGNREDKGGLKAAGPAARDGIVRTPRGAQNAEGPKPRCSGLMSPQKKRECLKAEALSGNIKPDHTDEFGGEDTLKMQQAMDHKNQLESLQSNTMKKADDTQNGVVNNLK